MSTGRTGSREERAARNQNLFREINERIRALNEAFDVLSPTASWVCECADMSCVEQLELTLAEYEAIRRHPDRFPVAVGHELDDVEVVVERHDGYLVVEKVGAAAELARQHDPRAG